MATFDGILGRVQLEALTQKQRYWLLGGSLGAAVLFYIFSQTDTGQEAIDTAVDTITGGPMGAAVLHRERAVGVDPRLIQLLDAWEREGTHNIVVAPQGGTREPAEQQRLFEKGRALQNGAWVVVNQAQVVTNADPKHAPHVRRGALDIWPAEDFNPSISMDLQPVAWKKFQDFGKFAESRGFTAGFRWTAAFKNKYGDAPHVEVKDWYSLPMPDANVA